MIANNLNSRTWIQLVDNNQNNYFDIEINYVSRYAIVSNNHHNYNNNRTITRFLPQEDFQGVNRVILVQASMNPLLPIAEKIVNNNYNLNQIHAALGYCIFSNQNHGMNQLLQNINQIGEGRHVFCYNLLYDQIN